LGELRRVTAFAKEHQQEFLEQVTRLHDRLADDELRGARAEHDKARRRVVKLDVIIALRGQRDRTALE